MKLAELQKKIADVLGVSASQKELSYAIFIDKISGILLDQITLKVPRIGFFQLKADAVDDGNQPLVFSPLSEDFVRDTRNMYLTLKVSPKIKTTPEPDSSIFSIGVGKPLLPLSSEELPDTETSYALLKKSIEERVKELIMESDQIPNFNIWDDYYKSPEKYENGSLDLSRNQLSDLTSDLSFSEEIIPDKIPDNILEVLDFNFDKDKMRRNEGLHEASTEGIEQADNIQSDNDYTIVGQEKFTLDDEEKNEYSGDEPTAEVIENIQPGEENKEAIENLDTGEENIESNEENEESIENLNAGEKNVESNETPDPDGEKDYSALESLEYDENPENKITLSQLLDDDIQPVKQPEEEVNTVSGKDADLLPTDEVLDKILNEEKTGDLEKEKEVSEEIVTEHESSGFEDLHKLIQPAIENIEVETGSDSIQKVEEDTLSMKTGEEDSAETEIQAEEISEEHKISDSEELIDEGEAEEEPDKIEWNWGDELREEFGIPIVAGEEVNFEPVNKNNSEEKNGVEFVDEYFEDEQIKKDFFSELEKTLEKEFRYEEPPKDRPARDRGKSTLTLEKNNLKKVVLEFSGPPSKYEFIEDQPVEKAKRMAITLIDDSAPKTRRTTYSTEEEINDSDKSSYSKKMFLIIAGAVIIIAVLVALVLFLENKSSRTNEGLNEAKQSEPKSSPDSGPNDFAVQSQPADNNSTLPGLDELNEFPRTATSPVPIKDATDKQILETIKKEAAKLETSKNADGIHSQNQTKQQTPPTSKNVSAETKISDRVFYDGNSYSLQISSWPTRSRADVEMNRLRGLGFNAVIVEANLPQKGGTWYRVRVGPFKTAQEANDFLKKNNF